MRDDPTPPRAGNPDDPYGVLGAAPKSVPEFDLDPRERQMWERLRRRARLTQAGICFWLFASTFVVVPLIFRHQPLWVVAIVTGLAAAVIGWFLPTNVPVPNRTHRDPNQPYGIYDPRGPHGPRS